ncbi:MAG: leucine-rich repeat domain-containing protein, partial [Bacilli bacterium]|nr:leucine-rich repeat domain-containing protein [Bacilli bacterium]
HAANQYGMLSLTGVSGTEFNVDGSLESGVNDTELNKIQYSGTKFDYIYMQFDDGNNVTNGSFCINGYSIDYHGGDVSRSIGYCNEQAGLYDDNGKLIKSWDELVALGLNIEKDYSNPPYNTTTRQYEYASDTGYSIFTNNNLKGKLVIPNNVTHIGNYVFYNVAGLTGLNIPSSVTSIGASSFASTKIEKIVIPGSVKTIGNLAFANNVATSVIIKEGVESIGTFSFTNYSANFVETLVIPDSVTSIDVSTFAGGAYKNIIVGRGITAIPDYAFSGKTDRSSALRAYGALENIIFRGEITSIGNSAFYQQTSLKSITFPSTLKSIGRYAFQYAYSLEEVILPEGLETLGEGAFGITQMDYPTALKKVYLPSTLTNIEGYIFEGNNNLEEVIISEGITSIGNQMFEYCESLTSISIPSSVKTIGRSSFLGTSLVNVALPEGVETIENYAFSMTDTLKTVYIPSTMKTIKNGTFELDPNLESVIFNNTIGWTVNGTTVDVTDMSLNASRLGQSNSSDTYIRYDWIRN